MEEQTVADDEKPKADERPEPASRRGGKQSVGGGDAKKDLIPGAPVPTSSQYGTNEKVKAQGDKVAGQNSEADLAGGSYAVTGLAAPLTPSDQHTQVVPILGDPDTSTSHVPASAGLSVYPGEQHVALVGEDGQKIGADDLFDDPGEHFTFVTAKQRVFEQFRYSGSTEVATRLFYAAGRRVDRGEARRIKQAITLQEQHAL
jgi:hypothetical protein